MLCGPSDVECKGAGMRNRAVQPDNNLNNLEKRSNEGKQSN